MTAIRRIDRLRGIGVFRDFRWPQELADFGRYNLIYGWNGSGKTTLSDVLRSLELRTPPSAGEVVLAVGDAGLAGDQFAESTLPVRVFNRDFVRDNVFRAGSSGAAPIFVLGKDNAERRQELDLLKGQLKSAEGDKETAGRRKAAADRALDQHCVTLGAAVKGVLRSAGSNPYNNYDKASYRRRAELMAVAGDSLSCLLDEKKRDELVTRQRALPKPAIPEVAVPLPDVAAVADTVRALLAESVTAHEIPELAADPELARWTADGVALHRGRGATECLYCTQRIPVTRAEAIDAHFSAGYSALTGRLQDMTNAIDAMLTALAGVHLPVCAEMFEDLQSRFDADRATVVHAVAEAEATLNELRADLVRKSTHAFDPISLQAVARTIDVQAPERLNGCIREHNRTCTEFERTVNDARRQLESDMVAASYDDFGRLKEAAAQAAAALAECTAEVLRLGSDIDRIERELVDHRLPAEQLNDDLRTYLGHDELQLEVRESGYAIVRGGSPALAISEGERTAIALLYFLKSLSDRRFDLASGIVVLDDPVSSLDANALFLAFGFIRDRTQAAGQLIILTHNFTFFRQVRGWFAHLKGQRKREPSLRPAHFYMVSSSFENGRRCSALGPLDGLLEAYESEYQYLFALLYRAASSTQRHSLAEFYGLPNTARRFLEAFLAFRHPHLTASLEDSLMAAEFDHARKLRILRFVHSYSHGEGVREPEQDLSMLGETPAILCDVMALVESLDPRHYGWLVAVVTREPGEGDEG